MELNINEVTKKFRDTVAVDSVSCTMKTGVYGLLGVNGAGKTTLMRMLCTLIQPTEGNITLDGRDIWEMDGEYRRILGYLPQDYGYYPEFTAEEYLQYIACIKGIPRSAATPRVRELLHRVGMEKAGRKKMKTFSGGMKRRIGIAQAMLNNPRILILDEPTAGLDPNERIRFRNLISELAAERLVLLSTHIVSDVEYIANEILLMKSGRIEFEGTPAKLLQSGGERVWSFVAGREEIDSYAARFKIVNLKTVNGGAELRVLAGTRPCPQAAEEKITMEDVFLAYFGEKAGEEDAVL